ncbi:hypothetical protein BDV38DRAFT_281843 [Aspergillus pseudotamarii]|uniref:F-box domain-containing protein n=1 Tax=Aspergillus pseudotamarii TaxID=132259 RepID=A0A5N6SZI8_ASPPS|nr:uncharacterized protein BDV38DRAFT_281843 [Aspergillus pseudotamarii]KAE8138534.1 hypothetical protein BDV38DRAFT_281843 [Aspergillus pseudotamarii]
MMLSPGTEELQPHPSPFMAVEIWCMIIDILCDAEEEDHDEGRSRAKCSLYLRDLINLSSTCAWFRNLLAPRIFAVVYLNNTAKSALSIKAIADGNFSGCIKELHYIANCEPEQQNLPVEDIYPLEVDTVLSNLTSFTGLQTLSVEFPFDYDELMEDFGCSGFNDDPKAAVVEEGKNAWRGLMAASFRAILSSYGSQHWPGGQIPLSLTIQALNIVPISVFSTGEFHYFLSQLRRFNMSLKQWDNGVGWMLNTYECFFGFPDCLGPWFFNHLTSVEEFSFDPQESAPLGDAGQPHAYNISLWKADMPRLRGLTLGNIYLCLELKDFLLRHLGTLESISLRECYSCSDCVGGEGMSWSELLFALAQKSPARLTSFSLHWDYHQEDLLDLEDNMADPTLVAQVRRKLEIEPSARGFPFCYCHVSDKYGYASLDQDANRTAFVKGEDYRGYQRLMAIVNSNATGNH